MTGCYATRRPDEVAARILAKANAAPRRTIRFVLFTGEEQGLYGSKAYVAKLTSQAQTLLHDIVTNPKGMPDPRGLNTYLDSNPPTSKTLFSGLEEAVIKEPERPAEQ